MCQRVLRGPPDSKALAVHSLVTIFGSDPNVLEFDAPTAYSGAESIALVSDVPTTHE